MIIGVSGKIGSGKDTIGNIIQYLTSLCSKTTRGKVFRSYQEYISNRNKDEAFYWYNSEWEIKKFADKLKDCVCLLIGCTRAQLEDIEFKNQELGEEWIRYAYASGFTKDNNGNTTMLTTDCDKERYELELKTNWQTAYKVHYTPRLLLQRLGTEAGRNIIHPNIWVNATFANYICDDLHTPRRRESPDMNWIITDTRFENEAEAIKKYHGILIRVNRNPNNVIKAVLDEHPSETSLDNYKEFDYVIENNGTIEELVEQVKQILIKQSIICQ